MTHSTNPLDMIKVGGIDMLRLHYYDQHPASTAVCGYVNPALSLPAIERQAWAASARRKVADGRTFHCEACQREVDFS